MHSSMVVHIVDRFLFVCILIQADKTVIGWSFFLLGNGYVNIQAHGMRR